MTIIGIAIITLVLFAVLMYAPFVLSGRISEKERREGKDGETI